MVGKHRTTQLWVTLEARTWECAELAGGWDRPFEVVVGDIELRREMQIV